MTETITIAGLKRLTLSQLRGLESHIARLAAGFARDSAQQRRCLADLMLIRREIAARLTTGPRPF